MLIRNKKITKEIKRILKTKQSLDIGIIVGYLTANIKKIYIKNLIPNIPTIRVTSQQLFY